MHLAVAIVLGLALLGSFRAVEAGARSGVASYATSSSAKQTVISEREYARFTVAGTHGYKILVSSALDDFGAVHLIVYRGHAAAEYLAFASRANDEEIQANLYGVGHISVHFHPRARSRWTPVGVPRHCSPVGRPKDRRGFFTGSIVFHGEGGYTSVNRLRVRGDAGTIRTRCPPFDPFKALLERKTGPQILARFPHGEFHAGPGAISQTGALGSADLIRSLHLGRLGKGQVGFGAESHEDRKSLIITRVAVARGAAGSLVVDNAARTARLRPPAPFAGQATITGCPRDLRGALTVQFPGRTVHVVQSLARHSVYVLSPAFFECGAGH
jgi:hypothetical protein